MIINVRDKKKKFKSYSHESQLSEQKKYKKWKPINGESIKFWVLRGHKRQSPKEKEIIDILSGMGIKFYTEVSFDLRKRFDFFIPAKRIIVEYDGMQHFHSLYEIRNDIYKESILEKNGVRLIRYNKTHNLKEKLSELLNNQ